MKEDIDMVFGYCKACRCQTMHLEMNFNREDGGVDWIYECSECGEEETRTQYFDVKEEEITSTDDLV